MGERSYALERLFEDQHPDLVVDTIPSLVAWLAPPPVVAKASVRFRVRVGHDAVEELLLGWDMEALGSRCAELTERVRRLRSGPQREHFVELAAYGLALVAISIWMPGARAIKFNPGLAPDILLDVTDGALRGVEVAGRTSGGFGALRTVLEGNKKEKGKRAQLQERSDVAEAHVSLWCARPSVSILLRVKP
jgi:hypothetical protein